MDDATLIVPAIDLSDDEFEARVRDPKLIETRDEAKSMLDELDEEIVRIQAQLDTYTTEAIIHAQTPERQAWFRRATYAAAMKRQERFKVYRREKELRGINLAGQKAKKDPTEGIAKQARLQAEAEASRAGKQAKVEAARTLQLEIGARKLFARKFMMVAKEMLTDEQFDAITDEAKRRGREED